MEQAHLVNALGGLYQLNSYRNKVLHRKLFSIQQVLKAILDVFVDKVNGTFADLQRISFTTSFDDACVNKFDQTWQWRYTQLLSHAKLIASITQFTKDLDRDWGIWFYFRQVNSSIRPMSDFPSNDIAVRG